MGAGGNRVTSSQGTRSLDFTPKADRKWEQRARVLWNNPLLYLFNKFGWSSQRLLCCSQLPAEGVVARGVLGSWVSWTSIWQGHCSELPLSKGPRVGRRTAVPGLACWVTLGQLCPLQDFRLPTYKGGAMCSPEPLKEGRKTKIPLVALCP